MPDLTVVRRKKGSDSPLSELVRAMKPKQHLAHIFVDVDMRLFHKGLAKFLKTRKITVEQGDYVVFVNTKRTIIKMFCNGTEALLHYKKDDKPIDPGVIAYLPKYCNGSELDVDAAKAEHLHDIMRRKGYVYAEKNDERKHGSNKTSNRTKEKTRRRS